MYFFVSQCWKLWSRSVLSNFQSILLFLRKDTESRQKRETGVDRSKRIACKGRHAYAGKHALKGGAAPYPLANVHVGMHCSLARRIM